MEIEEAVRRLGLADDYRDPQWKTATQVADRTVRKADLAWLEELLTALLQVPEPTYPMRYCFEAALRRLATAPGDAERVRSVHRIITGARTWGDRREPAEYAEWTAAGQPAEHLLAFLVTTDPADEFAACLLQEAALRHDARPAAGLAAKLRAAGHPLGGLPLRRTPAERRHGLPQYPGLPAPDRPEPGGKPVPEPGPVGLDATATEVEWPDARRARSAIRAWVHADADCTEARLYTLDRPLEPADFGASLLFRLDSESAGPDETYRVATVDVLAKLYHGAVGGSASKPGLRGAYGRLASWESLAALVGAEEAGADEREIAAIEHLADRCTWLFYTSPWHIQSHPSMDVGIAVLRPDHRTVAILAATDTD
ncbi:DUF6183 family protein [Actinomadura sp. LOL_016]|uniref:DUF6183 family protein n=1 Tax=unclassified Actinomadura TaxID=2626254 RepID=UPI003A80BEC3